MSHSNEAAKKGGMFTPEFVKELLNLVAVLVAITVVVAGLLGLINVVTKDRIEELKEQKIVQAMNEIIPDASDFSRLDTADIEGTAVTEVYEAKDSSGAFKGWCMKTLTSGFGGDVVAMVGVSPEGQVMKVVLTSLSETPGLGMKAKNDSFISQYDGKSGTIGVVKVNPGESDIVAISGATITSKAVTAGVQAALDVAARLGGAAK